MDYQTLSEKLSQDVKEYSSVSTLSSLNFLGIPLNTLNNIDLNIELTRKEVGTLTNREITTIHSLNSSAYTLRLPVSVTLNLEGSMYVAELYELQLYGSGVDRLDALDDLKANIIELYEELKYSDDVNLGNLMLSYKIFLKDVISAR